ncbi:hypothetical protein SNEBB_011328 [Seison nebaliae]|nr:hypothetical protein SNEBB_011328 [Seison nebaliae]
MNEHEKISPELISDVERLQELRKEAAHQLDSTELLIFVSLLIVVILTIWLFKYKRVRFVHETGCAIVYGLVIGSIIKYIVPSHSADHSYVNLNVTSNIITNYRDPPQILRIPAENSSIIFSYELNDAHLRTVKERSAIVDKMTFSPEIFFNLLLPPIIFYAGYSMHRGHFFKNFGTILTFAFIGTTIACFIFGSIVYTVVVSSSIKEWMDFSDCTFFGALISATDPVTVLAIFNDLHVDVDLYAMVFGESVMNDAVALVLADTIESFSTSHKPPTIGLLEAVGRFIMIFTGGFAIGASIAIITALITKMTNLRDHPLLEIVLFFLMSYSSFLAAEAVKFTGIVSILFCGILQAHYTYHNLSTEGKNRSKEIFELLSFMSENFIFLYIGITLTTFPYHQWQYAFLIVSFIGIAVARAISVYVLSFCLNFGRIQKISWNQQHMLWFSGLRGAVAFALAIRNTSTKARQLMITNTALIVLVTVIINGGLTTTVLSFLKIPINVSDDIENEHQLLTNENNVNDLKNVDKRVALPLRLFQKFDHNYLKPFLTHSRPTLIETCPRWLFWFAYIFTSDEQKTSRTSPIHSSDENDQPNINKQFNPMFMPHDDNHQNNEMVSKNDEKERKE